MNHSHTVDEILSWMTLGGYSQKQSNFPLQFIAHKATWEIGLKCILDHAISLPNTLEWLPVFGINTLIDIKASQDLDSADPSLLTAFDSMIVILDYWAFPQITMFSVTYRLLAFTLSAFLLFTPQLAYPIHSVIQQTLVCWMPINYQAWY